MKKENIGEMLLKGAIIGGGALIGLFASKFFTTKEEVLEVGGDGEPESIDADFTEVETETEGE